MAIVCFGVVGNVRLDLFMVQLVYEGDENYGFGVDNVLLGPIG